MHLNGTHYENGKKLRGFLANLKELNAKWLDGGEILGIGAAPIPSTVYPEPAREKVFPPIDWTRAAGANEILSSFSLKEPLRD